MTSLWVKSPAITGPIFTEQAKCINFHKAKHLYVGHLSTRPSSTFLHFMLWFGTHCNLLCLPHTKITDFLYQSIQIQISIPTCLLHVLLNHPFHWRVLSSWMWCTVVRHFGKMHRLNLQGQTACTSNITLFLLFICHWQFNNPPTGAVPGSVYHTIFRFWSLKSICTLLTFTSDPLIWY